MVDQIHKLFLLFEWIFLLNQESRHGSNSSSGQKTRQVLYVSGTHRYLYGTWMLLLSGNLQMIGWDWQEPPVSLRGALSHRDVWRGAVMAGNPRFLTHSRSPGQISLINSSQQMARCKLTSITWWLNLGAITCRSSTCCLFATVTEDCC